MIMAGYGLSFVAPESAKVKSAKTGQQRAIRKLPMESKAS